MVHSDASGVSDGSGVGDAVCSRLNTDVSLWKKVDLGIREVVG